MNVIVKNRQLIIEDKAENSYYQQNPEYFDELLELVNRFPDNYGSKLKAKSHHSLLRNGKFYDYLLNWIYSSVKPLKNCHKKEWKICTYCYWIFHDLHNFSKCSSCGKTIYRDSFSVYHAAYKICCSKCSMRNKESWIAMRKTCNQRYGTDFAMQSNEIYSKANKRYIYNSIAFDSAPEIAYYIWLTDHHISFKYHPCAFTFRCKGKTHKYFVDFLLTDTNQYVEIKGPQFLSRSGTLLDHLRKSTAYTKAKQKCMNDNHVMIISEDIFIEYMDYCAEKFNNKKWYRQFKILQQ